MRMFIIALLVMVGCAEDNPAGSGNNPYAGTWQVTFGGTFSGSKNAAIGSDGRFSFDATLSGANGILTVTGQVSSNGSVNADIYYAGSPVGSLTGTMYGSSGGGTYNTSGGGGTWTATKQ
ncbi:MAG TPA: hypothetical protein VL633_05785 [Bacteroidota bacterium]|nr:hypothetical protein [Bacteroidota bacterium]